MHSKSELKRLCTLDPVGMAERMHMLEKQYKDAQAQAEEQARLNGMGAERELKLLTQLEAEKSARVRAEEREQDAVAYGQQMLKQAKQEANNYREQKARADNLQAALDVMEPIAWIRQHPDGALTYEILHDEEMEPVRKISGAWKPLYRKPEVPKC